MTVEMHNTGDPLTSREIVALIEHVLSDKPGAWRVSIIGSRANDNWEMKVEGPKGFERSYTLLGSAEQHQPQVIASVGLQGIVTYLSPPQLHEGLVATLQSCETL